MTGAPIERGGCDTDTQREDQAGTEAGRLQSREGPALLTPPWRPSRLGTARELTSAMETPSLRVVTAAAGHPRCRQDRRSRSIRPLKRKLCLKERGGHCGPGRDLATACSRVPGPALPCTPQLTQPRSPAPSQGTPGGRGVKDPLPAPSLQSGVQSTSGAGWVPGG